MHAPASVRAGPLLLGVVGDVAKGLLVCLPDLQSIQSHPLTVLESKTGTVLGMHGKE